jgi:hypothetical protein
LGNFVKIHSDKVEIPLDMCITRDYINRLFMAVHSCPLLQEEAAALPAEGKGQFPITMNLGERTGS